MAGCFKSPTEVKMGKVMVTTNTLCRFVAGTDTIWFSKNDTVAERAGTKVTISRVWYTSGGLDSVNSQPDIVFCVNRDTTVQASIY